MWKLFLDDIRNVDQADRLPLCLGKLADMEYTVLRSSEEAMEYICVHGLPEIMALDHDLGGDDTTMRFLYRLGDVYDLGTLPPPRYEVHSSNPEGAKSIHAFMSSWLKTYTKWAAETEPLIKGWELTQETTCASGDYKVTYVNKGMALDLQYIPDCSEDYPWNVEFHCYNELIEDKSAFGKTMHEAMKRVFDSIQHEAQTLAGALDQIREVFDYNN